MPLYEYRCKSCSHRFEKIQKVADAPETVCPKCGGELIRPLTAPAFQFKGAGWYVNDYAPKSSSSSNAEKSGSDKAGDKSASDKAGSDKSGSDSSASSDSKPASSESKSGNSSSKPSSGTSTAS